MTTENNESAQSSNNADSANKESEVKSAADLIYGKGESNSDAEAQGDDLDKNDSENKDDSQSDESKDESKDEAKDESKSDDEAKDESKDESKDEKKEGEEIEVTLPKDSKLSKEDADAVKAFAKEHKLTKEQAEAVLGLSDKAVNSYLSAQKKQLQQTVSQWEKQVKADPELGGDKYAKSVEIAQKGYKNAPASMRTFLNETGLGSHPDVVKFFYKLGKLGLNDKMVPSGSEAKNEPKSHAQLIYGT